MRCPVGRQIPGAGPVGMDDIEAAARPARFAPRLALAWTPCATNGQKADDS